MKRRILIVDDDIANAHLVKLGLELTGDYEVRNESNGPRGIAAARAFQPDLVLLDFCMPEMDGAEVALQFSKDRTLRDIPIVFFTSLLGPDEAEDGQASRGGRLFLVKTSHMPTLIAGIEKNLPASATK